MSTRKTVKPLAKRAVAAKQSPKPKIVQMQRFHPDSRANRVAGMEVGVSISEAVRIDLGEADRDHISMEAERLKSTMSKAATLARMRSGREFVTESGEFMTRSGHLVLVTVVTRTE